VACVARPEADGGGGREIALGLAGFTGVIVVFGRDPMAPWHPLDSFRVVRMLSSSLAALFFSLLPEGLHATGMSSVWTWGLSSALLLTYVVLAGRSSLLAFRALAAEDRAQFDRRYFPIIVAAGTAVVLALALNVVGALWTPGYAAYYFGVLWELGFAAFQFVRIVFVRPGSGSSP
jgi:hypothetical protein